jgi:methylamine dehydrogenase accessory protein MauD
MSGFWLASYVALWLLVLVLAAGFLGLYHHFGQMYMNSREGRADHGPEIDSRLRPLQATALDGAQIRIPVPGRATLVVVSDTGCPLCQKLQPALSEVATEFEDGLSVVVLCSGRGDDVADWARPLSPAVRLVADRHGKLGSALGVGMTPFVIASDRSGIVRGRGLVNDVAGLREAAADALGLDRAVVARPTDLVDVGAAL